MAFTVTWKPNIGDSIVFNDSGLKYPIDDDSDPFQVEVEFTDPSAKRFQLGGEWPTFGYPGSARVICSGHINKGNGASFWDNRQKFLDALTPPDGELTSRRHGKLTISDTEMIEPMYGYCRIISRQANLQSGSPERCAYMVTWKAFTPYFTGQSTGQDYVLG